MSVYTKRLFNYYKTKKLKKEFLILKRENNFYLNKVFMLQFSLNEQKTQLKFITILKLRKITQNYTNKFLTTIRNYYGKSRK